MSFPVQRSGSWRIYGALVAMVSTFGALNGRILLQGRAPLAAAEDGLFPARFAKVHGERLAGTPVYVGMKWWQAKQAEKASIELVPPPAPASPSGVGAVAAMKRGS